MGRVSEQPPSDPQPEPPAPAPAVQSADDLPEPSYDPGTPNDQFMLMQEKAAQAARERELRGGGE